MALVQLCLARGINAATTQLRVDAPELLAALQESMKALTSAVEKNVPDQASDFRTANRGTNQVK